MPRVFRLVVPHAFVIALAALVRSIHVFSSPFPLGDGGLFLHMIQVLRSNLFALPVDIAFNGTTIPYVYPPLGFYAAGVAAELAGISDLEVMRFLPLMWSCVTVVVVWAFARAVLRDRLAVIAATLAFGTVPLAYRYFIMGAGVTRSPGLLFGAAAVWLTYVMCTSRRRWPIAPLALAAGLTVLSHPNAAWFAIYSSALVVGFFARDRRTVAHVFIAVGGAVIVVAPWAVWAISRHGVMPFLAATQSGNPGPSAMELLLQLQLTGEVGVPVIGLLAIIGLIACAIERRWWLPTWLLAACLLDTRYSGTFAMLPVAMLAGVAVRNLGAVADGALRNRLSTTRVAASLAGLCVATYVVTGSLQPTDPLRALPQPDRDAMAWIATFSPRDAVFLVVAPAGISAGSESEWFPVLARRRSLATYQGLEWVAQPPGPSPWEKYNRLQACGVRDVTCIEDWARTYTRASFDYVYVRERGTESLRTSLTASRDFSLAYHAAEVWVFARRR